MVHGIAKSPFFQGFIVLVVGMFLTAPQQALAVDDNAQAVPSQDVVAQEVGNPANGVPPQQTPPIFVPTKSGSPRWSDGWYAGGEGYAVAFDEYRKTGKPMIVYFNASWCPYCRKFEKEILSSPVVRDFLKDKIMVNINPEASRKENSIAYQYRVTGFPSFYVHPPQSDRVMRLFTGGTPQEFIEQFEQATQ